ncbi:MAG: nitroreductase family protein, partial [Candidatus Bathyarchaeota archaeon]|nr:nitroreductase family protein [Candidatus Bathyarchaeota archaeon]
MSSTLLKSIQTRRSVGAYTQKEVPQAKVITVLDAARWAPSAHNAQPWRFVVVTDHDAKRRLAEAMADEWAEDLA